MSASRLVSALALAFAAAAAAHAQEVVAVTDDGRLVTFEASDPGTIRTEASVSGLPFADRLVGLDLRADGRLYALGAASRLYRIDLARARATQVGAGFLDVPLEGFGFGMDFDPGEDVVRVVGASGQNLRIHPATGRVRDGDPTAGGIQGDPRLAYVAGDPNEDVVPSAVAVAHDRPSRNAPVRAYVIDSFRDVLARTAQDDDGDPLPLREGLLETVGPLGVNASALAAMDIVPGTGSAIAAIAPVGDLGRTGIYRVDLASGGVTFLGHVGLDSPIVGMTVLPPVETTLVALDEAGRALVVFDTADPARVRAVVTLLGLAAEERLVAVGVRPATGVLYGLGDSARLYAIDGGTGILSPIGPPLGDLLEGTRFGMAADPDRDRIHVASDTGWHARLHPDSGRLVGGESAPRLRYAEGDPRAGQTAAVTALAFARAGPGADATLYGLDANLGALVRIGSPGGDPDPPATSRVETVGSLGTGAGGCAGLAVPGSGSAAFALLPAGAGSALHRVSLASGAATRVADVGAAARLCSLADFPRRNPPPPLDLRISRLVVRVLPGAVGRDRIRVRGTIPFPGGSLAGRDVSVDVGGVARSATLGARARADLGPDRIGFGRRPRTGRTRFRIDLRRGSFASVLADEGLDGAVDARRDLREVLFTLVVDGVAHELLVPVRYSARAGVRGFGRAGRRRR